jgi:nitrogen-specific signal transduction histidine kinase
MILAPALGIDLRPVRVLFDQLLPAALLVLGASMAARYRAGDDQTRSDLRVALIGFLLIPVALGILFSFTMVAGGYAFHLFLPFAVLALPMSIGYAIVRRDIFATSAVITRRMLWVPIAIAALLVASAVWFGSRSLAENDTWAIAPALIASILSAHFVLMTGGYLTQRWLFVSAARFRPTVQQLSDELASLDSEVAIGASLERLIARWLPTTGVTVLAPEKLDTVGHVSGTTRTLLAQGQPVWTQHSARERRLIAPMRCLGELCGLIVLEPKYGSALYTSEDLALLATIASLGAVALHNAMAIRERDRLRALQVSAARGDKRRAIETMSAEIAHEIAYPVNYFRFLLDKFRDGAQPDVQDVDVGRDELARLQRMLTGLRRLQLPTPEPRPLRLIEPVKRALDVLREPLSKCQVTVCVSEEVVVLADPDPCLQLIANLVRNAARAAGASGCIRIEYQFETDPARPGGTLSVLDSGPGIPEALCDTLFHPWVAGPNGGMGLGLAISQRIARSLGWSLSHERRAAWTCFSIGIPAARIEPFADPAEEPHARTHRGR